MAETESRWDGSSGGAWFQWKTENKGTKNQLSYLLVHGNFSSKHTVRPSLLRDVLENCYAEEEGMPYLQNQVNEEKDSQALLFCY